MEKLDFDFESASMELANYADRLNAALDDCGQWYFDELGEADDEKMFKVYFGIAKIRKEIADDYARKIKELSDLFIAHCCGNVR